jgi:NAD(P)H-flavin reductase
VAGGTGLAPMLSMLRRMAEFQEPHPARLYFGVNRAEELFCLTELEALKVELPQLQVIVCVWKPDQDWLGFCGTPVDALNQDLDDLKVMPDIYLCGPPALIDAAEAAARAQGVPIEQVYSERFLPA